MPTSHPSPSPENNPEFLLVMLEYNFEEILVSFKNKLVFSNGYFVRKYMTIRLHTWPDQLVQLKKKQSIFPMQINFSVRMIKNYGVVEKHSLWLEYLTKQEHSDTISFHVQSPNVF